MRSASTTLPGGGCGCGSGESSRDPGSGIRDPWSDWIQIPHPQGPPGRVVEGRGHWAGNFGCAAIFAQDSLLRDALRRWRERRHAIEDNRRSVRRAASQQVAECERVPFPRRREHGLECAARAVAWQSEVQDGQRGRVSGRRILVVGCPRVGGGASRRHFLWDERFASFKFEPHPATRDSHGSSTEGATCSV